jgi:hypothetical protein
MKRRITLTNVPDYENNSSIKTMKLLAEIENIKIMQELEIAINELQSLGFEITRIDAGEVQAEKRIDNVREILDPKYNGFRCIPKRCEEE